MGFAGSRNREYINIWNIGNKTNQCDANQTTDLYIKMPKKHSRQRSRREKGTIEIETKRKEKAEKKEQKGDEGKGQ